jgi:cytochrome c5
MRNARSLAAILLFAGLVACGAATANTNTTATNAASEAPAPVATPLSVGGATLPAGAELSVLQNSCGACHSVGMVTQQRLSAATWKAEVTKMRGFGAPIKAAQEPAFVAYLSKYLGPQVPRSSVHATATAPPITYDRPPQP